MNYTIEKQLKKAPIVKYIMIGSISLTLLLWILGLALSIIQITAAGTISFMVTVSITLVYIEMFRQLSKSMKLLNKLSLQDVVSDLKTTEFNLPKSKIYMGSRAFYAKKPAMVLPYSMVVWVYIQRVKYMGIVTIEEKVIIRCRDGASFEIRANRDELQMLLQGIAHFSPDLIVGYGASQRELYDSIVMNFPK